MDSEARMPPLPEGMPCPGCGYDVGGLRSGICPECGRAVTRWDAATFERAVEALAVLKRVRRQTLRFGLAAAGVLGVAVGAAVWDGLAFVAICASAAGLTAGVIRLGWLVGRGVARAERPGVEAAFIDSARWLLLPWGVVAPTGVAVLALGRLAWLTDIGDGLGAVIGGGLLLWMALTLLVTLAAVIGPRRAASAGASQLPGWAWALAILLLWGPSAVLGGVSLAAVLIGAAVQSDWQGSVWPVLPSQK